MKLVEYDILTKMTARFGQHIRSDQFGNVFTYYFEADSGGVDLEIGPYAIQIFPFGRDSISYSIHSDRWYVKLHVEIGSYAEMTDTIIEGLG